MCCLIFSYFYTIHISLNGSPQPMFFFPTTYNDSGSSKKMKPIAEAEEDDDDDGAPEVPGTTI